MLKETMDQKFREELKPDFINWANKECYMVFEGTNLDIDTKLKSLGIEPLGSKYDEENLVDCGSIHYFTTNNTTFLHLVVDSALSFSSMHYLDSGMGDVRLVYEIYN